MWLARCQPSLDRHLDFSSYDWRGPSHLNGKLNNARQWGGSWMVCRATRLGANPLQKEIRSRHGSPSAGRETCKRCVYLLCTLVITMGLPEYVRRLAQQRTTGRNNARAGVAIWKQCIKKNGLLFASSLSRVQLPHLITA